MKVKEQAEKIIFDLIPELENRNFNISPIETKQYNFELSISNGSEKIKLLIYFGKKGIKKVLQGNASSHLYKDVSFLINESSEFDFGENKVDEPEEYIGSDESGKGDIFKLLPQFLMSME